MRTPKSKQPRATEYNRSTLCLVGERLRRRHRSQPTAHLSLSLFIPFCLERKAVARRRQGRSERNNSDAALSFFTKLSPSELCSRGIHRPASSARVTLGTDRHLLGYWTLFTVFVWLLSRFRAPLRSSLFFDVGAGTTTTTVGSSSRKTTIRTKLSWDSTQGGCVLAPVYRRREREKV